jgi:hypothetical protein
VGISDVLFVIYTIEKETREEAFRSRWCELLRSRSCMSNDTSLSFITIAMNGFFYDVTKKIGVTRTFGIGTKVETNSLKI